jgi:hypothetical protein
MIKHNHQDQESRLTPHFRSFWPVSTHSSRGRPRPAPASSVPLAQLVLPSCRAPNQALANEARVDPDGPRPSHELVAIASTQEQVRPNRPCPPCAPCGPRWGREPPAPSGHQRTATDNDTAGQPACPLVSGPPRPRLQRRGHPSCRAAFAACLRGTGHRGRPSPSSRAGAVAARCERRCPRRPCHPRARSSGHQRYAAVSHGHSKEAVGQGAHA